MENIEFTKEQFKSMTRLQKAEIIMKSIECIQNGKSLKIDEKVYTELSGFIYWVVDNV